MGEFFLFFFNPFLREMNAERNNQYIEDLIDQNIELTKKYEVEAIGNQELEEKIKSLHSKLKVILIYKYK